MSDLLKIDIGCGSRPKAGYTGVDIGHLSANVIKSDAIVFFKALPDKSVSHVYSRHFLEHLDADSLLVLLREIDRTLIDGGEILFIVPHFSNPYFYSDPTHRMFYGVHSFSYICETSCLKRRVPKYICIDGWNLYSVKVKFVSMFNLKFIGIKFPTLATFLNLLVNLTYYSIEIFERYLSSIFSIYEVKFLILKSKSSI